MVCFVPLWRLLIIGDMIEVRLMANVLLGIAIGLLFVVGIAAMIMATYVFFERN